MKKTVIATDASWVNALEIAPNGAWVQPGPGEHYVWGANDPTGPAAVVAKRFEVKSKKVEKATLFLSVDNYAIVLINGLPVVIDAPQDNRDFYNPGRMFNISHFLHHGENDIVIAGFNYPQTSGRSDRNPAGILARIEIKHDDHKHDDHKHY
ncbi:hypothetical protein [Paenibacillus whitsoniae]|uniref:Uncharacterized protein n=1 Tax=Paenibacillus whitsoniae TaxID=2496558 RepID=A0A3S0CRP6_9BACL|nr:hypothetical protein [Paenibacillus whitsoniae]RTE05836.1 hypothetical protein EJQ19_24220 [Paenibacillus whitsoniae]